MSNLGDLEAAVVGLIAAIQSGGSAVFRSASGFSDPDRKRSTAHLRRQVAPAALVIYSGRLRTDAAESVVGLEKLTVLVSAENLRGRDDPRTGDGTWHGGFELLGFTTTALDGVLVQTDRRLIAIDEQVAYADETHVVYEQRYAVDRVAELAAPTFDGVALAGAGSLVNVVVGEVKAETQTFAFPGIDGVYRHHLGMRSRPIVWRGQLRASSDAALNTIESGIEAAVANPGAFTMVDSWSRSFADCVCERFVRTKPRRRHPTRGDALQPFEVHFAQLNV